MELMSWRAAAPAIGAAFLGSLVEAVEAFTIVLAVGMVQGWRVAAQGALAGLALLCLLIVALGPMLDRMPLHVLQLCIGVLLLLFGMRWLRKAILRAAGIIPGHDETAVFHGEMAQLQDAARRGRTPLVSIAGLAAFKAIVLEGLEVVFIVIAVGAGRNLIWPASFGALAACALVVVIGLIIHQPLARVPENTLKFGVGVMLSAFGVFWTGEGLGVEWPGQDLALVALVTAFLSVGLLTIPAARRIAPECTG